MEEGHSLHGSGELALVFLDCTLVCEGAPPFLQSEFYITYEIIM